MAAYLSPIGNEPWMDSSGAPLNGGEIYTYSAGTSTPAATYTDSTGAVPQANPIVLNASGLPANPIWIAGGASMKFIVKDSGGVTISPPFDNITGINDPAQASTVDQWVLFGAAPTYISATSFSVAGDQTATFQVGRRLKSTNTGGTIYSTVMSSAFGAVTTVTVSNDSGVLDAGMSDVSYGFLSASSPAVPGQYKITASAAQSGNGANFIDFTGLPSWAKRHTLSFAGVGTAGVQHLILQLGDSGGVETAGYLASSAGLANAGAVSVVAYTTGIGINSGAANHVLHGQIVLTLVDAATNTWAASGNVAQSTGGGAVGFITVAGSKALTGTLDRLRFTTITGLDPFDEPGALVSVLSE